MSLAHNARRAQTELVTSYSTPIPISNPSRPARRWPRSPPLRSNIRLYVCSPCRRYLIRNQELRKPGFFNQEGRKTGKDRGFECCRAFDSLGPLTRPVDLPSSRSRRAAPFYESRDVNVAAKFFPTSLAVPLFFLRSCFESLAVAAHPLQPNSNLWFLFS